MGLKNVKTHYNKNKGDILFTFYNGIKEWNLCYNENLKKFITFYSWTPSHSANIDNIFFTFDKKSSKNNLKLDANNNILKSTNGLMSPITGVVDNKIWKHGQSGIYDNQGLIMPTNWYGELHPFEFEFVVADIPIAQKIFNNLKLISNKVEPESFEFEIVGESYDWFEIKDLIIWINNQVKSYSTTNSHFVDLPTAYKYILGLNLSEIEQIYPNFIRPFSKEDTLYDLYKFPKLPYLNRIRKSNGLWEANSANVELRVDDLLNEDRIHTQQNANNMKKYGRVKGNMQYKEDVWDVEIRPITFKYAYLKNGILNYTVGKELRIRDKYVKIRVKYTGKDLTIIQAIKTNFTISYA